MKIIFTSPGRRVELIKIFKNVFPKSKFYGGDCDPTSPANYFLEKIFKLPYQIDDNYAKKILEICRKEKIDILIPLIDPELIVFARKRKNFFDIGTFIMISSSQVIDICMNKWKTYKFFKENNILCPETWLGSNFNRERFKKPVIIKPYMGSASKNIFICNNSNELGKYENFLNDNYIIQEFIKGYEVTVDVFATEEGKCIEAVQRRRLKVRGGEVERGVTQKDPIIFKIINKIVKTLKPLGVINIQFIIDIENNAYYVTEINPRFGGGYPLAYTAGANFPLLLYKLAKNKKIISNLSNYKDKLYMLRYDNAVYADNLINLC